jgi:hypothetical protein
MWATEDGERVLTGKRAAAFAKAAGYLLSSLVTKEGEYPTGISPFDDLTYGQKVSCLDAITRGLLRQDVPAIEPTLPLDAAIVVVYGELWVLVSIEMYDREAHGTMWRQLVVQAVKESAAEHAYDPAWVPDPASTNEGLWLERITGLQREILEDTNQEAVESVADLPGNQAREIRKTLGISDEYALMIPDDPNDRQIEQRLTELHRLLRSVAS